MKHSPIIFCHYGDSKYLPYVFKCVRISNPNSRIILLGDDANKVTAKQCGIEHVDFEQYNYGADIDVFEEVYELITTAGFDSHKHGKDWNKFVFKKWFMLFNFLEKNDIERFWHFDSDNLIFSDLTALEEGFQDIDCAEQCDGKCVKGIFNNRKIIDRYCKKINELFLNKEFIEKTKAEMAQKTLGGCFSEMSAYEVFKKEEDIKIRSTIEPYREAAFDDLICISQGYKMEKLPFGEDVKVIHMNKDGRFFAIHEDSNKPVQMHALNFSWMPIYIFDKVLKHYQKTCKNPQAAFDPSSKTLSQIQVPLRQQFKKYRKKLKSMLKAKK